MPKIRDISNIPPGKCVCSVCNVEKDNIEFQWYKTRYTKDGYRLQTNTNCLKCSKRIAKELREIKKGIEKTHPQPMYGECCDMCKKPVYKHKSQIPAGIDGTWGWQCDHDHQTKEFRGWICKKCNTGFGGIGDTKESVLNLVIYKFGSIDNFIESYKNKEV